MKRIFLIILFLILTAFGLSFALLNAESVQLKYYFGSFNAPLSLILVIGLMIGAVLGALSCVGMIMRLKRDLVKLHKTIKLTEKEVANLRALPIKDKH